MKVEDTTSVVVCAIGEHLYAIPVDAIMEVAALVKYTPLPAARPEVLGVINRRGTIIPLLDLRLCLGQKANPPDLSTLFVVVQEGEYTAGLVVDDVKEVITLPATAFKLPTQSGPYVKGMAAASQTTLVVLDTAALLRAFAPTNLAVESES